MTLDKYTKALSKTLIAYEEILEAVKLQQTTLNDMKDYIEKRDKIYQDAFGKFMSSLTAK